MGQDPQHDPIVLGVAWYRQEQWQLLRSVSEDRDRLEATYEAWLRQAEETLADMKSNGLNVRKVEVDVNELAEWCSSRAVPVNSQSRSDFVADKTRTAASSRDPSAGFPSRSRLPQPNREVDQSDLYWQERLQKLTGKGRGQYPLATVAYYGPTDEFATKTAVSVFLRNADHEPDHLERWICNDFDVRFDKTVNQQILQFLKCHKVRSVAIADRIIGCPHEEAKDYPDGEKCPRCPFWANRDRWTGEVIE